MPTWMRIAFMLLAVRSDNMESTLKQIGYMALSWCLRGFLQSLMRPIMIPKLVRMGKMHPEVARQNKPSWRAVTYWLVLTAAVAAFLAHSGVVRMTVFLAFTTLVLPLFRALVFPRVFPVFPFLIAVCYAVWRWEGVQELFLGLVLFQALPTTQELLVHYHGVKRGNILGFLAWVSVAVAVSPVVLTFALAYLAPEVLEFIVVNRTKPQLAPYWAVAEWYYGLLGFATADGENPYRVLGVPQTASETQIRKRFRQLSIKYHPDKTGNDPKKKEYFMKLQGAMEVITKGTFDGPANENAMRERMRGAVTRCSELTPIIGIWTVLAAWAFLKWLTRDRSREMREARAASEGEGAGEENADLAREIPREYVIGPSFLGGSMLGYGVDRGDRTRERYGDAGPRAEARTVGGRRVATPQVPMPRLDAAAAAGAGTGAGAAAATPSAAGLVNRGKKNGKRR